MKSRNLHNTQLGLLMFQIVKTSCREKNNSKLKIRLHSVANQTMSLSLSLSLVHSHLDTHGYLLSTNVTHNRLLDSKPDRNRPISSWSSELTETRLGFKDTRVFKARNPAREAVWEVGCSN